MERHIVPVDDLRDHESSPDCWCKPVEDDEVFDLWIHNSMDGREQYERGDRKLNRQLELSV